MRKALAVLRSRVAPARFLTALTALAFVACGPVDLMDASADRSVNDGSSSADRSVNDDVLAPFDASESDANGVEMDGSATDARVMDAAVRRDVVSPTDAGRDVATDGARTDASADGGTMLTGLPTCMAANVTAMQLYTGIVSSSCTGARCHDPGSAGTLAMGSVAQMRTNLLAASATASIPRVTPGDIHNSYVMYKLLGQQARVTGGRGNRMPPLAALNNAQICQFVNWIRSGAR